MSQWTKEQLENMLEDVVNELDLSHELVDVHGQLGTAPAKLVRMVLQQKNDEIRMLRAIVDEDKIILGLFSNRKGRRIGTNDYTPEWCPLPYKKNLHSN